MEVPSIYISQGSHSFGNAFLAVKLDRQLSSKIMGLCKMQTGCVTLTTKVSYALPITYIQ